MANPKKPALRIRVGGVEFVESEHKPARKSAKARKRKAAKPVMAWGVRYNGGEIWADENWTRAYARSRAKERSGEVVRVEVRR